MNNSKLISLLSTFTVSEWRRFGEFLASPFFNKREDLILFHKYLKSTYPLFEETKLTEHKVFKAVYPKQKFNHKNLIYLNNYLLKQAERFLIEIRLEQKTNWSSIFLIEELMERKMEKHFKLHLQKTTRFIQEQQYKSNSTYLLQYYLTNIAKQYFLSQSERKSSQIFQQAWNNLDEFYFYHKLKSACEILELKNVISVDYEMTFIEELIQYLRKKEKSLGIKLSLYLTAYTLLTEEVSKEKFLKFKDLLKLNDSQIPDFEKRYLYTLAINYCGQQIKRRNDPYFFVEQCLALYINGIEKEFIFNNGHLSPWTFKNVVKLGFNLKKFDWTGDFIEQYYRKLKPEFQKDALHYNLADLKYRKKQYHAAQEHLLQVEYSDIFYNLGAKTMLIKIYYELQEEEVLLSNLASFAIFLKRNKKITVETRHLYLNFVHYLNRLLRSKPNKVDAILEDIKKTDLLINKNWLIEKASQLKK